jgi:DNA-binding response OmpR family regulator
MVLQHRVRHPEPVCPGDRERDRPGWRRIEMRVLVAEDHAKLAMTLAAGLRKAGMAVDVVLDGQDALDQLALTAYDVVVLDRDLPRVHGDDVCRALVAEGSASRVLMLTASGSVENRVDGLDIGADDYLPKPCDFTELVARVRALVRRPGTSLPPVLVHGDLQLDPARRIATRAGRPLPLTPKEFAVLELLLAAPGVVVSAEEILERVWDEAADPFTQAVRVTMSRLRAKLGAPPVIETVAKVGYRVAG